MINENKNRNIRKLVLVTDSNSYESKKYSMYNLNSDRNSKSMSRNYSLFINFNQNDNSKLEKTTDQAIKTTNLSMNEKKLTSSLKLPFINLNKNNSQNNQNTLFSPISYTNNKKLSSFSKNVRNNKIQIKNLNFSSGSKYLLSNPETVFITNHKIKQTVGDLSKKNYSITENENNKRKINSLCLEVKSIEPGPLSDRISYNKKHSSGKLFLPFKGMNHLRRMIALHKGHPHLYINKFYKNENIDDNNLLLNLFEQNNEQMHRFLYKSNHK